MLMRFPILWLTLRQFAGGKAIRVVGLFAATPVLFALIYALNTDQTTASDFLAAIFLNLLSPTVVPLATLVLATAALGNEVSDRTMVYLVLKPVGRWRIVIEKYAGTVLVTFVAFAAGTGLTWLIALLAGVGGSQRDLLAIWLGSLVGIVAYAAVFFFVSLLVPRALLVGIIYILLWESLLARFIPGIKLLSVRHFTQSIYVRYLDDASIRLDDANQIIPALIVVATVLALSLLLATFRLRVMNLE